MASSPKTPPPLKRNNSWVQTPDSLPPSNPTFPDIEIKKIGVATCGGDCPGLNAVIRAVTVSAISNYGWEVIGIEDSTSGLINLDYRGPHGNMALNCDVVDEIISKGGTILGSSNKSHPFAFKKMVNGKAVEVDVSDQVVENFHKLGLDALVIIGGDGSMEIAGRLLEKGIPIVGVPKTIDNDLLCTDYTFGFNTSCQTITEAIDKIRDTALSHDRVIVIEVMGRNAGWLAIQSGIAGAADVILIPEIPYENEVVLAKIRDRRKHNQYSTLVVIAEGACPYDGDCAVLGERAAGEMLRYGGAGDRLVTEMMAQNKKAEGTDKHIEDLEIRCSVLGYTQRGGSPSNRDRVLGTCFGLKAVELIREKKFGYMAALEGKNVTSVPMSAVTRGQKLVDLDGGLVVAARRMGICLGDFWPNDNVPDKF